MKIASLGGMSHFSLLHSILAALVRHIYLIAHRSVFKIQFLLRHPLCLTTAVLAARDNLRPGGRRWLSLGLALSYLMIPYCLPPLRLSTSLFLEVSLSF